MGRLLTRGFTVVELVDKQRPSRAKGVLVAGLCQSRCEPESSSPHVVASGTVVHLITDAERKAVNISHFPNSNFRSRA